MLKPTLKWAQFNWDNNNYLLAKYQDKIAYLNIGENCFDIFLKFVKKNNYQIIEDLTLKDYGIMLLDDYRQNNLTLKFEDLWLTGTAFQKEVWKQTFNIKYNEKISYQDLANKLAKPLAVRAVGTALGQNPILVIIPCHRIIAKSGKVNYAAGPLFKLYLQSIEDGTI